MIDEGKPKVAVFVDRDHTLIDDPGYISDPDQVHLLDGIADGLRRLREAGLPVIVVSNQSGVARGLFTEQDLEAIHQRLRSDLQEHGADVDAIYYCPFLDGPEAVVEEYRRDSNLRKPKPGMLLKAAREMNLDLIRSWMIGDSDRDVQAGRSAGCRTILTWRREDAGVTGADYVTADFSAAVDIVLASLEPPKPPTNGPVADPKPLGPPPADVGDAPAATDGPQPRLEVEPPTAKHGSPPKRAPVPDVASDPKQTELLGQILEELRVMRREGQYEDFSIAKLAAAVVQAIALCAIGRGLYVWIAADPAPSGVGVDTIATASATIALLAGVSLQLLALTLLVAAQKK